MTLKMGSRSPKSNQFFFMSQQYSCAGLVKIHRADKPFFNNLSPCVTLKWGQGHQNLISSFPCHNNIDVQV